MSTPTDAEMPAAIAELMGWDKIHESSCGCYTNTKGLIAYDNEVYTHSGFGAFRPMTDRNHSRLAVERCAELKLLLEYGENLAEELNCHIKICDALIDYRALTATPAQETRAAYRTLFEHQTTEGNQQ